MPELLTGVQYNIKDEKGFDKAYKYVEMYY